MMGRSPVVAEMEADRGDEIGGGARSRRFEALNNEKKENQH
jgi:hypothetical protein